MLRCGMARVRGNGGSKLPELKCAARCLLLEHRAHGGTLHKGAVPRVEFRALLLERRHSLAQPLGVLAYGCLRGGRLRAERRGEL